MQVPTRQRLWTKHMVSNFFYFVRRQPLVDRVRFIKSEKFNCNREKIDINYKNLDVLSIAIELFVFDELGSWNVRFMPILRRMFRGDFTTSFASLAFDPTNIVFGL